jgi:Uma2 family endonuclease
MTSAVPHHHYTLAEYVRLEGYANVRHEFYAGQIFAMAGGTREHGALAANLITLLNTQLRGRPCQAHTSDVRICVQATGLHTYPDVSVICGRPQYDAEDTDAVVNPIVIAEVLSPSTESYDQGEKLEHYKRIPALREVVFVAHGERRVDVVRRVEGGAEWTVASARPGQTVRLSSLGCDLSVDEVYRDPLATSLA